MKQSIGIDLGGTNIKAGLVDKNGKIIFKTSVPTETNLGYKHVIGQIKKAAALVLAENSNVTGIGIGAPGIVSAEEGTVKSPPNIPGWKKVNLAKILFDEFGKKVFVENDANAAAIGESIFGVGRSVNSFIMVTLGTGVGGGIIYNGQLFRGETGGAGEIGHVTINYKGRKCNCGSYGCIETYVGNQKITEKVKREIKNHPDSKVVELAGETLSGLSPKTLYEAAKACDDYAVKAISEIAVMLGAAFASAVNLLDISTIVLGGGVSGFGNYLLVPLKAALKERVLAPNRPRVKVKLSKLKNDAGIKGASSLAFYHS
jgi:glucokinase